MKVCGDRYNSRGRSNFSTALSAAAAAAASDTASGPGEDFAAIP
jgi:hypothetical protein